MTEPVMDNAILNEAIDLIYTAVEEDAALKDLAPQLGRMIGADAGDIVTERPQDQLIVTHSSFGFDPAFLKSYDSDFLGDNTWFDALRRLPRDQFHTVEESAPDHRATRYFNEWVRPQHFGQSLGAVLESGQDQYTWIGFVRESGQRKFDYEAEFLTSILPHLRRMMQLRRHFHRQENERMGVHALLDHLHLPVFIVQRDLKVLLMNEAAQELQSANSFLWLSRDARIQIEGHQNEKLGQALRLATSCPDETGIATLEPIAIHDKDSGLAVMHFIPLPQHGTENGADNLAIIVRPVECPCANVSCLLSEAYGLTETEARLANFIGSGASLAEFAASAGMAPSTARWHLKNVEQKTGTSRIEQVVALVRNFQSPLC
ncbi:MAG: helix-turn-helix transcriptional regulator [Thalassovita sp.]|nr:helix-turn-helix transcriptional regulator [Thalassovita sp.]